VRRVRPPDPHLVGDVRRLVDMLAGLRAENGSPTLKAIARRIDTIEASKRGTSSNVQSRTSTGYLSQVLRGLRVPTGDMAAKIVKALWLIGTQDDTASGRLRAAQDRARAYAEAAREELASAASDRKDGSFRIEAYPLRRQGVPEGAVPSLLLSAGYRVVAFTGREAELNLLTTWRDDARHRVAVRLLHASGGQGKTRVAAELAARSHTSGWVVVTGRHNSDAFGPARTSASHRRVISKGVLVVVDYAERWPAGELVDFVLDLRRSPAFRGRPIRVLLLSRPAGAWWQGLRAALTQHHVAAADSQELKPMASNAQERHELFRTAVECFASELGLAAVSSDAIPAPIELDSDPEFSRVLTVHMAALAAVEAHINCQVAPTDPAGLSQYLLDRERLHWQRLHAKAGNGGGAYDEATVVIDPDLMARASYVATLIGPLLEEAGIDALSRARIASDAGQARQILACHRICYPPADDERVLEPLYPGRMGEDFIALATPGHSVADNPGYPWAVRLVTDLLGGDQVEPLWGRQAVAVLIDASERWPHLAVRHVYPLLRTHPELAIDAGVATLSRLLQLPGVTEELLAAIDSLLEEPDLELQRVAVELAEKALDRRLEAAISDVDRANVYYLLGRKWRNVQRYDKSRERTATAIVLLRASGARTDEYAVPLAMALSELSWDLDQIGDKDGAYNAAEEAIVLWTEVNNSEIRMPEAVAVAFMARGTSLAYLGRRSEALDAYKHALDLRRRMSDDNPRRGTRVAAALLNISDTLNELSRWKESQSCASESVGLYRQEIKRGHRGGGRVGLTRALWNLAAAQWNLGLKDAAIANRLAATVEMLAIANVDFDAYGEELVEHLGALQVSLRELGRTDDKLQALKEGVDSALGAVTKGRLSLSTGNIETLLMELGAHAENA
jgi:tetratricopeptide (TPR) repeat protein